MRSLIITSARGYDACQLIPFLELIRRNCSLCDVVIITLPQDALRFRCLQARYPFVSFHVLRVTSSNANGIPTQPETAISLLKQKLQTAYLLSTRTKVGYQHRVRHERPHPFGLSTLDLNWCIRRYHVASYLLNNELKGYRYVMLSDVRDVILQDDPFQGIEDEMIYTGLEGVTVESNESNATWIKAAYGMDVYRELACKISVCSGVTIGSSKAITCYLSAFCLESCEVMRSKETANLPVWDQAFHIKMLLLDDFPHIQVPIDGFIATLGMVERPRLRFDSDERILVDGKSASIVHQYDRHADLRSRVEEIYV